MTVRINEMSKNDTLIKINQLYKIFGDGQEDALELVKNGLEKKSFLINQIVF